MYNIGIQKRAGHLFYLLYHKMFTFWKWKKSSFCSLSKTFWKFRSLLSSTTALPNNCSSIWSISQIHISILGVPLLKRFRVKNLIIPFNLEKNRLGKHYLSYQVIKLSALTRRVLRFCLCDVAQIFYATIT